jgi:hypothetical protein
MSGASNLGYGNINPYNMSSYVNGTSSNYSGSFSSNEIPGCPGLSGTKSNVDAAAGKAPMNGGAKNLKRKIKNITKHYKRMKAGSKKIRSLKHRIKHRAISRQFAGSRRRHRASRRHSKRRHSRRQRGGYSQYMNNMPNTPSYQVAGINIPASQLALANPAPITRLGDCVNCVDNYNHYTNQGFPSRGN